MRRFRVDFSLKENIFFASRLGAEVGFCVVKRFAVNVLTALLAGECFRVAPYFAAHEKWDFPQFCFTVSSPAEGGVGLQFTVVCCGEIGG